MDYETGEIGTFEELRRKAMERRKKQEEEMNHGSSAVRRLPLGQVIKPIDPARLSPRVRVLLQKTGRAQISRNSPCPCGSGKKFKKCCMILD